MSSDHHENLKLITQCPLSLLSNHHRLLFPTHKDNMLTIWMRTIKKLTLSTDSRNKNSNKPHYQTYFPNLFYKAKWQPTSLFLHLPFTILRPTLLLLTFLPPLLIILIYYNLDKLETSNHCWPSWTLVKTSRSLWDFWTGEWLFKRC